jgi:hypothetical protein
MRVGGENFPITMAMQFEFGLLVITLHSKEIDKAAVGVRGDVRVSMLPQHKIVNNASYDFVG